MELKTIIASMKKSPEGINSKFEQVLIKKVSKIKDETVEIIHYEEQEDKKNEDKQNPRGIWNTIKQNTQATQVLWETNKKNYITCDKKV